MSEKYDENVLSNVLFVKLNLYKTIVKRNYNVLQDKVSDKLINSGDMTSIQNELDEILNNISLVEKSLKNVTINYDSLIERVQEINNKLSSLIKQNGTKYLEDMLLICYGEEYINTHIRNDEELTKKLQLFNECSRVMSYKIVSWNLQNRNKGAKKKKNNILEDVYLSEISNTLDVHNIAGDGVNNFLWKLYGFKLVVQNEALKQTIVVSCMLHNIPHKYLSSSFFQERRNIIEEHTPSTKEYNTETYYTFLNSLTTKELLVYSCDDIYDLYMGYLTNVQTMKGKILSKLTREFMNYELYDQRLLLVQLLMDTSDSEAQYIAYLLYDMLSTNNGKAEGDNLNQSRLYNSFPPCIQVNFKHAMKSTIEYTSKLLDIDLEGKLPLEQRICLMKVNDSVKEKAMMKVKELRAKNDDSGSKARHYIEGLLKIPFGIYNKEYVLNTLDNIKEKVSKCSVDLKKELNLHTGDIQKFQIINACKKIKTDTTQTMNIKKVSKDNLKQMLQSYKDIHQHDLKVSFKTIKGAKEQIVKLMEDETIKERINSIMLNNMNNEKADIYHEYKDITDYMSAVHNTLDKAAYGHDDAKKQIERIVGQWITGEQSGYCFGFEGPPGVGKTSLAKEGIAKCLKDKDGNPRPFGFIAMGGSSNGSTLDGHNYTYVGSMWGKIVDILIESKCMNPVIFIDEIDKVSRTEAGREIIGILTHLVDPTQNDKFQDKYFSGIDLDLSKVLFVFSYNDVGLMDSILLDRIHRVRFKHLSVDEKITITRNYVLPEYAKRMGYSNSNDILSISDEVIKYLIDNYTAEAGVRKLKEILFEIISEINLELLQFNETNLPVIMTKDLIKNKYLEKRHPITPKLIHNKPVSGIINGLWANALGKGGIIQIETKFVLSGSMLDMKLTGMQGDVMKESMAVSKSLAWSLTPQEKKDELLKKFEATKSQGIHIHCPEGAVPKDGPSAGTAITTCVYSLLNDIPIRNDIAITGEMNLQGQVTAIGGLDLKILGGITAGVKLFLFPKENERDFEDFMKEWGEKDIVKGITFHSIETIEEALSYSLVK
jgi:hypothetical protein